MRVETLGPEGRPEIAAVGAIHGDEPCGTRAIERFLAEGPTDRLQRPVRLVVANERALAAGERFVDVDLNRVFPGDPDASAHERRLAARLLEELDGAFTLGFHSTVSSTEPFGTLANLTPEKARVMRALPLAHAADFTGVVEGRSVTLDRFVNVETGPQGSDAATEDAYDCLLAYLREMNALPGESDPTATTLYRVTDLVEKDPGRTYDVLTENFQRVPAGQVYARSRDGEHVLRAGTDRWPVLMSAEGHETLLGYTANEALPIETAAPTSDGSATSSAAGDTWQPTGKPGE